MSRTWAYWLQNVNPAAIAASDLDTVVVEIYDGDGRLLSNADVAQMGGGADPRTVLGYLSVGEAETYRAYWQPDWNGAGRPAWIGPENPEWEGNHQVRFWADDWKKILFDYLKTMVEAGYDGAWFDVVDVYQTAIGRERADPAGDMVELVQALSQHAKALNPSFKIYINGAEELLSDPRYLAAIDGMGKENAYFGLEGENTPNSAEDVRWTVDHMKLAQVAGKDVLVIEYVSNSKAVAETVERAGADGFAPYVGPLDLDALDLTISRLVGAAEGSAGPRNLNFQSMPGDDTFTGAGVADRVMFSGERSAYTIGFGPDGLPIAVDGPDGHDTLIGIERLVFKDVTLAFDEEAHEVYRAYHAGFNRAPEKEGASFWVSEMDTGKQNLLSMSLHILHSREFVDAHGDVDHMSSPTLVEMIYSNILGRMPTAPEISYWTDRMMIDLKPGGFLAAVSESPENRAITDVQIVGGVELLPE